MYTVFVKITGYMIGVVNLSTALSGGIPNILNLHGSGNIYLQWRSEQPRSDVLESLGVVRMQVLLFVFLGLTLGLALGFVRPNAFRASKCGF